MAGRIALRQGTVGANREVLLLEDDSVVTIFKHVPNCIGVLCIRQEGQIAIKIEKRELGPCCRRPVIDCDRDKAIVAA